MKFQGIIFLVAVASVAATPVAPRGDFNILASNCGPVIGNCYDNNCQGTAGSLICTNVSTTLFYPH